MKKHDRKWYKKKAIVLAKKIRRTQEGRCERCGRDFGKFDGAHIVPVDYEQTASDLSNILCLCVNCHTFGKDAAHNHPTEFSFLLDDYAPGLSTRLRERANQVWPKVDWESKYKELVSEQWNRATGGSGSGRTGSVPGLRTANRTGYW